MVKFLRAFIVFAIIASFIVPESALSAKKEEKVTINFVDIELPAITKFISDITGKNFIFDERLKGKITIIAPSKISVDEAFNLFTSVLELKGFTVIPSGTDAYKIVPSSEAKQGGIGVTTERQPINETYMVRLITLRHITTDDAIKFLQPMVSKNGHIAAFGPNNMLLLVDSGTNMEKLLSILDTIDQPAFKEEPEIIYLKNSNSDTVSKLINEGFGKGRTPQQGPIAVSETRLNAIVLFGDFALRESIKGLIGLIDVPSPQAQSRINVYFLENADATELAKVLDSMIKGTGTQKQPSQPGATTPFESATGITITPDKTTNSLIIVASPADYQNIVEVIKKLDKRRKQVFVEAMITEVSLDKLLELGAKWRVMGTRNGEPIFIGGVGTIDQGSMLNIVQGLAGLTLGGMANFINIPITTFDSSGKPTTTTATVPGLTALFSLNEFRGVVNVLSTPQLLTSDNEEAEIVVGENVPFISKRELTTQTQSLFSAIERKDVGITLRLTPQITEGDYVKLDLYQEISSVKAEVDPNIIINVGPTTTKRSTKTSVVVKDAQTVVIGGLIQEKEDESINKVPLLGDIPILGWLFKSKSKRKTKTNLLVFITPHIIKEAEGLSRVTEQKEMAFARSANQYVEGELLVKFKEGVPEEKIQEILKSEGASIIRYIDSIKVYHIKLKEGKSVEDAIEDFKEIKEIEYSEPNYKVRKQ